MKEPSIRTLAFLVASVLASRIAQAAEGPVKPIFEATFVSKVPSKPPANRFLLRLTLKNPGDERRWIILPYFGNDRVKSDTIRFYARPSDDPPFESSRYRGRGGDVVIIHCYGSASASESFNAVLLPPRCEIVFENFEVMTFGDRLDELEFLDVESVLVNGETPLDRWLPYSSASGDRVFVPKAAERAVLDFDSKTTKKRTDYPSDPARFVRFKGLRKTAIDARP
jgi:hypothetical protein